MSVHDVCTKVPVFRSATGTRVPVVQGTTGTATVHHDEYRAAQYLATSSSAGKRRGSAETLIAVRRQYCNTGHRVSWGAQRDALHCEEDVLLAPKHVCVRRMPQHDPRRTPTRGPASPVTMNSSGKTGVHGSTSVVSTSEASRNTSSRRPSRRTPALAGRASSSLRAAEREYGTR